MFLVNQIEDFLLAQGYVRGNHTCILKPHLYRRIVVIEHYKALLGLLKEY